MKVVVFLAVLLSLVYVVRPSGEGAIDEGGTDGEFGGVEPGKKCSTDSDCEENECCLSFMASRMCWKKGQKDESCDPNHGEFTCGCQEGLKCLLYKAFGTEKFYRCSAPRLRPMP